MSADLTYRPILGSSGTSSGLSRRGDGGRPVDVAGTDFLSVDGAILEQLAYQAITEISHRLRTDHLRQLRAILDDPQATENDRFVALDLLKNADIAARGILPMCQDTGTVIITAKRGHRILTDGRDEEHLSRGIHRAYQDLNLRFSQLEPITTWEERNTGTNLPAQIEIALTEGDDYELLVMAKGGGSANKSFLFQSNASYLDEQRMLDFLEEKVADVGTTACPPYHLAVVIGGTSAEASLKTAKLASARYLDDLPSSPDGTGFALRDRDLEEKLLARTRTIGYGAQFGGKYFCHDVRIVRLPRHNGSLPIALAVSCSADRQTVGRITRDGWYLEDLEENPGRFLPESAPDTGTPAPIDLDAPMAEIRAELSKLDVGQRVSLTGTMVVARDLVHSKVRARLEKDEPMPDYLKDHAVYYAGPAKTPEGMATGSFGPTTGGRMDGYVEQFQAAGGSLVMLAKGNRSDQVTESCQRHGGFYLGSIGGPAARLAQDCILSSEVIDYAELGMEAVHRITVKDFPAFLVVDDKGDDFFRRARKVSVQIGRRPQ